MSRFPRLRRRRDAWSDDHARARTRVAERMDGPLGLAESTWLDEHLGACPTCGAMAAAFEDDRIALRALRDQTPEAPRDLWARTTAAIEAEAGPIQQRLPVGALSGLVVVVLVVGVSLVSGTILFYDDVGNGVKGDDGIELSPGSSVAAGSGVEPTPFAVDAGAVGWIDQGPNAGVHTARVKKVCPVKAVAGCPALETSRDTTTLAFTIDTKTIVGSPSRRQAVAIAKSSNGGDDVVVVALPEPDETTEPSAAPAAPSSPPAASAAPIDSASSAPSASEVDPSVQPSASPLLSPEPSLANTVAIASGIEVVGESAAFSPDGSWFAFTARPADGSGADVYVWRVGGEQAVKVTNDGTSYFASWSGNEMIASRPSEDASEEAGPVSVQIDPATRMERDAGELWRPVVDPTGRFAIAWDGSIQLVEATKTWSPARGTLELRRWSADGPRGGGGSDGSRIVADEAAGDFDARWDEAGEWVAVWVAESSDSSVGQLTLYHVDQANGRLERVDGSPVQESALPGFSMGDGRLAWATPPGEGGEGSRIQIAAWSEDGVGVVESGPGNQLVVIR
jgi:hypothetical protein